MQELELEIKKKTAPNNNVINVKILAKATTATNEKIRHQGLSSKEILFSRDQFTSDNLRIDDEKLAEEKVKIRNRENVYSAKSKADLEIILGCLGTRPNVKIYSATVQNIYTLY